MVDNILKIELLINSEAFFIQKIENTPYNIKQCLDIEHSIARTNSIRTEKTFTEFLNNYLCFGLFNSNNILIGYSVFSCVLDEAELIDIKLHNKYCNKGLGFNFLKITCDILKQENIQNIILEVAKDNLPAIKTYQKLNAEKIGIRKNYYTNTTDNSKTDAIVYKIEF